MPARKLKEFLDKNKVKYVRIVHSEAFTAPEIAAAAHIPGKDLAKTVMINVDGSLAMAVVSANRKVDFDALKHALGAQQVSLASEDEFKNRFPDCEVGAMPPFGNLYDLPVYVSEELSRDEEIAFNAGNHYEVFKMKYGDYANLVKPRVLKF